LESKTRDRFRTSPEYIQIKEEKDQLQRKLLFLGFFSEKLKEKGVNAIIVGGEAIDIWTGGTFASADIDLLVESKKIAEKLLNKFGFEKKGNTLWLSKDLAIVIHIIESSYSGDYNKLKKMTIGKYEIQIASPEYLIKDRLCSFKFWKDNPQSDMEKTVTLLKIFSDSIDNSYLNELAKENDIEDVLDEARKIASKLE
jgi:hypothetical protein